MCVDGYCRKTMKYSIWYPLSRLLKVRAVYITNNYILTISYILFLSTIAFYFVNSDVQAKERHSTLGLVFRKRLTMPISHAHIVNVLWSCSMYCRSDINDQWLMMTLSVPTRTMA